MGTDNETTMTLAEKVAEVFGGDATVGDFYRHYLDAVFIPAVEKDGEWAELSQRVRDERRSAKALRETQEPAALLAA